MLDQFNSSKVRAVTDEIANRAFSAPAHSDFPALFPTEA